MTILVWIGFLVFIFAMVLLDLGVFHRKAHTISIREALTWTGVWVALALVFNVFVYFLYQNNWLGWTDNPNHKLTGTVAAVQFLTGYLIEKSLSIDNIFVIAMVFAFFKVPATLQHRVLFWGIMGAVLLRGLMIGVGTAMIHRFEWTIYIFGALLIYSAIKMLTVSDDDLDPDKNLFVRLTRKLFAVTSEYHGRHFFVRQEDGKLAATPLLLALVLVESCDVMFAVDSIPAILAITRDSFLVFTSNIFAILGLRSLFFAISGLMDMFQYMKISLVFLLTFVGVKMMLPEKWQLRNGTSLVIITLILATGVLASIIMKKDEPATDAETDEEEDSRPEKSDKAVAGEKRN